jgi:hypothetical protein
MSAPHIHLAGVLTEVALTLAALDRRITLSFSVDAEFVDAIALLPGAEVHGTVYVATDEEPYVIRAAKARIGKVELEAQAPGRPATSIELESAGGWHESERAPTRIGTLRSAP